jgi:thiol-disulfide isomerase/thioredoxin
MSYKSYSQIGKESSPQPQTSDFPEVPSIKSQQHRNSVINGNLIVVIDVWGSFCEPCRTVAPAYAALSKKYTRPGFCVLYKENIEDQFLGIQRVTGVPCFHFYVQGKYQPDLTVTGGDLKTVEENLQKLISHFTRK